MNLFQGSSTFSSTHSVIDVLLSRYLRFTWWCRVMLMLMLMLMDLTEIDRLERAQAA